MEAAMENRSDRTLDRVGGASGIAAVILLLALIMATPALRPPNHSITEITQSARENADGILRGAYMGMLFSGALLVFGAALAARLRRAEGSDGGWWLVALAGIAGTSVGIVSNTLVITFVRAVGHGAGGNALWVGYPSGPDGVLIAVPLAVFLLGVGLGARTSSMLPRWLAWLAVALAAMFVLGAGGVMGDEVDGGILGAGLVLGYAGLLVWIVGSSVSMLRRPASLQPAPATALG
jgi:hypothetical protein